jgi:hypothetical protein
LLDLSLNFFLQKLFIYEIVAIVIQCFCIKICKEKKTKEKVTDVCSDLSKPTQQFIVIKINISEFIVLDEFWPETMRYCAVFPREYLKFSRVGVFSLFIHIVFVNTLYYGTKPRKISRFEYGHLTNVVKSPDLEVKTPHGLKFSNWLRKFANRVVVKNVKNININTAG